MSNSLPSSPTPSRGLGRSTKNLQPPPPDMQVPTLLVLCGVGWFLTVSWVSFIILGRSCLYYLVPWLAVHGFFYGLMEMHALGRGFQGGDFVAVMVGIGRFLLRRADEARIKDRIAAARAGNWHIPTTPSADNSQTPPPRRRASSSSSLNTPVPDKQRALSSLLNLQRYDLRLPNGSPAPRREARAPRVRRRSSHSPPGLRNRAPQSSGLTQEQPVPRLANGDLGEEESENENAEDGEGRGGRALSAAAENIHDESDDDDDSLSEDGAAPLELQWAVGGTSQLLRRSSSHRMTPEQQMVQDLLQNVSDTPGSCSAAWRLVACRHNVRIWTAPVADSPWLRIRGRMRCEATPAQLLSLLIDDHRIGEYDRMFDRMEPVERVDDHTSIRWVSYRAVWPTRPRDFVIKTTWEEFADGTIVVATKSVDHPSHPPTPTYVRGRMVMCGFVITPCDAIAQTEAAIALSSPSHNNNAPQQAEGGGGSDSEGEDASTVGDRSRAQSSGRSIGAWDEEKDRFLQGSEITMYTHSDLGGGIPSSIVNRLCRKPAYRVLRKIQKMAAADTLVAPSRPIGRTISETLLQGLIDDSKEEMYMSHARGRSELEDEGGDAPSTPNGSLCASKQIRPAYAMAEARRIMGMLSHMASDASLEWVQLGGDSHHGMNLYKCPVAGTRRMRLGASTTIQAAPEELLGILLESAAMLGPDYVVDRQVSIESLRSGVGASAGPMTPPPLDAVVPSSVDVDDTVIYWFSCAHKRQRIRRDFVILRCYHPLPDGGGLIAYTTVDHPAYPPTAAFVRGKIEMCGFVIVPKAVDETDLEDLYAEQCSSEVTFFTCLSFSEFLPALEDLKASQHLVGPLHILQELKRVVNHTLEYAAPRPGETEAWDLDGGGHAVAGIAPDAAGAEAHAEQESLLSRVAHKREAALRDLLTLASDGESMDGPQVDWKLVRDGGDEGVRIWKCDQVGSSWSMIRTRSRLNAEPGDVLSLLLDDSRITEYDDLFDKIWVVERIDDCSMFKRTAYKPVWPTAPRDFSLLSSWGCLEDGSAYLVSRSVEHPDVPEMRGFVRGIVMMCGFLMVPSPQGGCTLTMLVHTELGGNLPVAIVNKISIREPANVVAKLFKLTNRQGQ